MPDDMLTVEQAAALIGVRPRTLEGWRTHNYGLPFVKVGRGRNGFIRYRLADVQAYLAARRHEPPPEPQL